MCTHLGAEFTYGLTFKRWFKNPVTDDTVYVYFDLSHMVKLVRNPLGDKKVLLNKVGDSIKWQHIENLYEYQTQKGLKAANKSTKKHIYYEDNKMNGKLTMQTFRESVYNSLRLLENFNDAIRNEKFSDAGTTTRQRLLHCLQRICTRTRDSVSVDRVEKKAGQI